jgi:hypothetical protein
MGGFGDRGGMMVKREADGCVDRLHIFQRKMFDLWWDLKLHTSMSFHATKLKQRFLIPFLLVGASIPAFSQAADSPIVFNSTDGIKTTLVDLPSFLGSTSGGNEGTPKKWLKIEFKYAATPAKGDYVDAVQFKVWVEGRDLMAPNAPGDEGVAVVLTGSVTYVNIPKDKDTYGVFYVHPCTMGRYSTKQGYTDFERKFNVHLDAIIDGKVVDNIDKNKETDLAWYQKFPALSGFVYRQDQCPFLLTEFGRYPPIKLSDSGSGSDAVFGSPSNSSSSPGSGTTPGTSPTNSAPGSE